METEYLNIVNKELHDIQQFFAHYYSSLDPSSSPSTTGPSILLPEQRTLSVLPLLKLPLTTTVDNDASFDTTSSNFSFSSSLAGGSHSEREQYLTDLRDRYKQLKAIQDQMHLELTRARILRQSMLPPMAAVGVGNGSDDGKGNRAGVTKGDVGSSHSFSLHEEDKGGLLESTRHEQNSFTPTPLSAPPVQPVPEPTPKPTATSTTTATTAKAATQITTEVPNMRHVATKLCKNAKAATYFAYKSTPTRYILLALGLAIILGGLLDNSQDRQHIPNQDRRHMPNQAPHHSNRHGCFREHSVPTGQFSPPENVRRYPWPRH